MKIALLTAGSCGLAAVIALAAQGRPPDAGGPVSRVILALDADHDGAIAAGEMRAASTALAQLDINRDGQLTPDELRPLFGPDGPPRGARPFDGDGRGRREGGAEAPAAPAASASELTETLMGFDRSGDGTLTRAEVPERFQGLFERADADKDGALTRAELQQSATATVQQGAGGRGPEGGFGRRRGGMDPVLRALDTDRDGTISSAELTAAADTLSALDADKDGQLTGAELRPQFRGPEGRDGGPR